MKVTVDVELHESELQSVPQIQQLFQGLCDQVKTRVYTDRTGLSQKLEGLVNADNIDAALEEISRRLQQSSLYEDCVEVLCALLFSETRLEVGGSTFRYVTLLKRLPDAVQPRVKEAVTQTALHILAAPRRIDVPRGPLLPVCETVAWMVKLDLLSAPNAVRACAHLLRDESTRSAAITCLCKLVEFAFDTIVDSCSDRVLDELRSSLGNAHHDSFVYDIEYITDPFGWSAPSQRFLNVHHQGAFTHHESSILAMAYSPAMSGARELVVTSSMDGVIATWDGNGKGSLVNRVVLARHYAAALDIANRGRTLLVAGNGRDDSRPAVIMYDSCWSENGAVEPDNAKVITALKSVRSSSGAFQFACAVTGDEMHQIGIYDAARCSLVNRFLNHNDVITNLFTPADRDNLMLSGSRDSSVAFYDLRASTVISQSNHHFSTVTCLGMYGDYIVSGGLDRRLVVSDLRMGNQQLAVRGTESAILSLSVQPDGTTAVGTMSGLHLISLASGNSFRVDALSAPRYNCVSWNSHGNMLFCGGDTSVLDVYTL